MYINRPWNPSKLRYTINQLSESVPSSMRKRAIKYAADENRELNRDDFILVYREPTGEINLNGVVAAIEEISGLALAPVERALATAELENHRRKAEKELGISSYSNLADELSGLAECCYSSMIVAPSTPVHSLTALESLVVGEQINTENQNSEEAEQSPFVEVMGHPDIPVTSEGISDIQNSMGGAAGFRIQNLNGMGGLETRQTQAIAFPNLQLSPQAMSTRMQTVQSKGVVENDFRPLPDYKALGIDRSAGPATAQELRAFLGQNRSNGSPVTGNDFFSAGALLANIDIIPHLMAFIPPVELDRLSQILTVRSKKSDQNHSREVLSGNFTVVDPKIGTDEKAKMNADHPLLGKTPYTALIARLIFPIMENDPDQIAAVESARRGRLQNLSIAFGYRNVTCGLCGEMPTKKLLVSNGNLIGFTIDPESNCDMCSDRGDDDDYYYPMSGTLRTPVEIEGGYMYRNVTILKASADGTVQIDPIPQDSLALGSETIFMTNMRSFYGYTFCRLHGLIGTTLRDGRKTVGMFSEMRALINVASVDAGAICDARIVLDPSVNY